jgi:hypothetical protein
LTDHLHLKVKPADHIRRLEFMIEPTEFNGFNSLGTETRYLLILKQ